MRLVLRARMAWLGVGLAACAFRVASLPLPLSALVPVFCIFTATRLQNDWRDRNHDLKKGKRFASGHPGLFLGLVFSSWALCGLLIVIAALQNRMLALLLLLMVLEGLIYSETRRVPWLPISISVLLSASPAFFPATLTSDVNRMLPLFAVAALFIFGREMLKDLEDSAIDAGYKWTIPVAYGERTAKWLAIGSIVAACAVAATISPWTLGGSIVAVMGLFLFSRDSPLSTTMNWLDIGAALVVVTLVMFPSVP
jgi:4-hydroxybenzoate polyprenyltransferase